MIKLDVFNRAKTRIASRKFQTLASKAARVLEAKKNVRRQQSLLIELSFVGESAIRRINKKCRHKNKPTDVISLSYFDESVKEQFAGEIFICLSCARKQAKRLGHSLQCELEFLFVHGLLHVFGYDHKNSRDEAMMNALTEEILSS